MNKNTATLTLSSVYTKANTKYSFSVIAFTKLGSTKLSGAESDPCVFKTPLGEISNLRTAERTSFDDGKVTVYSSLIWDSIPNAEYIAESRNTAIDSSWRQIAKSDVNMVNVNSTVSGLKATKKSDYVTTLSWSAVPGASKYIIKSTASENDSYLTEIASTSSTSIDLNLAPSTKLNLVVLAVANSVSYRVKAVDADKINPDSAYKTITASNFVIGSGCVVYTTPAPAAFNNSAESQRAYTLKLIQAINNTKDEKTPVTGRSDVKLEANVDTLSLSGIPLVGKLKNEVEKEVEKLKKEMNESKSHTLNFNNGIAFYKAKDSKGNEVNYSQRLNSFIVPTPDNSYETKYAYLYNQNDLAAFSKNISNVKVSESAGKTTVSLTINKEGTNAVYHPGFVDSITGSLGVIGGDGASCTATVGASTITGVINSSGTLDSLRITSPFTLTISMDVPVEVVTLHVKMVLSGSSNYNYTFTR